MRVDVISREYPPEVYGGAGVHVAELVAALRERRSTCVVRCFGLPRDEPGVLAYLVPPQLADANPALATLGVDLQIAEDVAGADLVHSHTWYANGAGHLAKMLHGIPHVVTAHSLEPLRPWKAEQLGGGYQVSSWIEKTAFEAADAVIAVSARHARRHPALLPAIDPERGARRPQRHRPRALEARRRPDVVRGLGIDPDRPSVVFVGRITRQKGLPYLLARGQAAAARGAARALRRRARHPRDPRRGAGRRRRRCRRSATASSGSSSCCRSPSSPPCCRPPPRSSARRSTSRSASSTSRRWPAARPSSEPRPAASPRSSPTG